MIFCAAFLYYIGNGIFVSGDTPNGIPGADNTCDMQIIDLNNKNDYFVDWVSWPITAGIKGPMGNYIKDNIFNYAHEIAYNNNILYIPRAVNDVKYSSIYSLDLRNGNIAPLEIQSIKNVKYSTTTTIDGDGNQICNLSDCGVSELTYGYYSDGVLNADLYKVFDLDGKLLFDKATLDKSLLN